jgi:hypothetical protein
MDTNLELSIIKFQNHLLGALHGLHHLNARLKSGCGGSFDGGKTRYFNVTLVMGTRPDPDAVRRPFVYISGMGYDGFLACILNKSFETVEEAIKYLWELSHMEWTFE